MAEAAQLTDIPPAQIDPNPENPRLVFRESEMNALIQSIREVGIRVPLAVYADSDRFVLIDGERRWRSALRLNLKSVPAIVQPKPGPLENLLTMFNIHNVRVDWDLMPMALKLARVRELLVAEGKSVRAVDLAGVTSVPLPTVRRALELLDLPTRYQKLLLKEAEKPRDQQKITADVFVEINKSKRVIERYLPEVFEQVTPELYVDAMVEKYSSDVVNNVVRFRDISKIARAERAGGDRRDVSPIVLRLVTDADYSIERAYSDSVERAYSTRDIESRAEALSERIESLGISDLPASLRQALLRLRQALDRIVGS